MIKPKDGESLWTLLLLKLTHMGQVENHARYLRMMRNRTMEDMGIDEADVQQLLDELTGAKNNLVQHSGYLPRQWVLGSSPGFPDHALEDNSDVSLLRAGSGNRLSTDVNVGWQRSRWKRARRSEKSLIGRSRRMRGDYVTGVQVKGSNSRKQGHWMGPARVIGVEGSTLWVSHGATTIKCAKEHVRMASLAEKETRELMTRLGAEDRDSRKAHEPPPRQQDLNGQQPTTIETTKPTSSKEPTTT